MEYQKFKDDFDKYFLLVLKKLTNRAGKITKNKKVTELITYINKLGENGKRIRPYVMFLAYGQNKIDRKILNQLLAIEMLHLFALIHDDVIDKSITRHGVRTINSKEKNMELGNSYALLMGDLVFAWSQELFVKNNQNEKSIEIFQKLIEEVIIGQTIDVELAQRVNWTHDEIKEKKLLKTARYTFRRPVEIGLCLSGKDPKKYIKMCENLGIIFQIDDDLLDINGDSKKMKKKTFQDIEARQATIISYYLLKEKGFKKYFGKKLNEKEKKEVKEMLIKSGALDKINKEKGALIKETHNLISKLPDSINWNNLLEKIINRNS